MEKSYILYGCGRQKYQTVMLCRKLKSNGSVEPGRVEKQKEKR